MRFIAAMLLTTSTLILPAASSTAAERVTEVVTVTRDNMPAVVSIWGHKMEKQKQDDGSYKMVDQAYYGSGYFVDSRGFIVTQRHCVLELNELQVLRYGSKEWESVEIVSWDKSHDLALLQLAVKRQYTTVKLNPDDDLMLGERVIILGNPAGLGHSVTAGLVSGLGRNIEPDTLGKMSGIIQTDAPINGGNSGGPVFDVNGLVVGSVVAKMDGREIGFLVPVKYVRAFVLSALKTDKLLESP